MSGSLRCRGSGTTRTEWGEVRWNKGDVFALPSSEQPASHHADENCEEGAATFYWVNDSPLMSYLGCVPRWSPPCNNICLLTLPTLCLSPWHGMAGCLVSLRACRSSLRAAMLVCTGPALGCLAALAVTGLAP